MKTEPKYLLSGVTALAIALGALGGGVADARNTSGTIKPSPPAAAAAANDLCGVPYTPPCSSAARNKSDVIKPNPLTAAEVETGQLLDKGPRWPHKATAAKDDPCKRPGTQCDPRDAQQPVARNKSDTIKPNPPTAVDYETGQLLIKDKPK